MVIILLMLWLILPTAARAQFDALDGMERDFFRLSEPCTALPAEEQRLEGVDYRLRVYRCGERIWRLWQVRCPGGGWSHTVKLDSADGHAAAYYMDRFAAWHRGQPADLVESYRPPCGGS